ncbi:MAG TPA: hypothetical protein VN635_09550 [Conexibacter sp.]|nr:hypothetical protein [Conexibacter sp.]
MRRILLLVVSALALTLAVPAAASAHHGRGRHRHHHHHHHAKAHHARTEHFGAGANTSPSAPPDAGTVDSFTNGVLTIRLADGSTVSGKVTADTNINCVPAVQSPAPTAATAHDGGWGDRGDQGDDGQGDDHQDGGRCHGQSACTVADLVPGAVVHEAILKLGGNGAEFKLVLLVKQQQATS